MVTVNSMQLVGHVSSELSSNAQKWQHHAVCVVQSNLCFVTVCFSALHTCVCVHVCVCACVCVCVWCVCIFLLYLHTYVSLLQSKCAQYWSDTVSDPYDVGNGLVVTLLEVSTFADYEVKTFSLGEVRHSNLR